MVNVREVAARVVAFDRSRGRGIVDIDGRAVVVDASIVDASHLVPGDLVTVEIGDGDKIAAVRVVTAAKQPVAEDTRGLFAALLDAQKGAPLDLVEALAARDDVGAFVRAWLERWDKPVRFWEPNNVAEVVDRRHRDDALTMMLVSMLTSGAPPERDAWVHARLRVRSH
jgi:hypothetical protein